MKAYSASELLAWVIEGCYKQEHVTQDNEYTPDHDWIWRHN